MRSGIPYVLDRSAFRFPRLAALAGKAPAGNGREVVMASYLLARLSEDALPERGVPWELREVRAVGALKWLSRITVQAPIRAAMVELAKSTAGDPVDIAAQLRATIGVCTLAFDRGSRAELEALATRLESSLARGVRSPPD
jgi:hypothetical protein